MRSRDAAFFVNCGVTPKFLTTCEAFQPAEKACWEILLRDLPGAQDLPHAAVIRAIDRSLHQLWSLLRAQSVEEWLQHPPPGPALIWLPKECGLKSLLDYFGAGQRALQLIVQEVEHTHPGLSEERRAEHAMRLKLAFNVLVQRELNVLCGECVRNGRCTLSGHRPTATPPESSPVRSARRSRRRS